MSGQVGCQPKRGRSSLGSMDRFVTLRATESLQGQNASALAKSIEKMQIVPVWSQIDESSQLNMTRAAAAL